MTNMDAVINVILVLQLSLLYHVDFLLDNTELDELFLNLIT